jgi:hypothetical protein
MNRTVSSVRYRLLQGTGTMPILAYNWQNIVLKSTKQHGQIALFVNSAELNELLCSEA